MISKSIGDKMVKIEKNRTYLVTGGSGFLGGELIERILNAGGKVVP